MNLKTISYSILTYSPLIDEFVIVDVMSAMFFRIWSSDFQTEPEFVFIDYWIND